MPKFTYNDLVKVNAGGGERSKIACVVGIFESPPKQGTYFRRFSAGTVYTVEFEDGASTEVHEDCLEKWVDEAGES